LAGALGVIVAFALSPLLHLSMQRAPMRQRYTASGWHCMNCGCEIEGVQRFPFVAKVSGRLACTTCGQPVFRDTPWFELVLACLLGASGVILGLTSALPAYFVFVAAAFTISVVDLRLYLIPSRMLYPALFACLLLMLIPGVQDPGRYGLALAAMAGSWLFFFIVYFIHPRGLGFGDVRLSALNGFMSGWVAVANAYLAIILGLFAGAIIGVALVALGIKGRKDPMPFGPWLALGAVLAVFGPIALA
jgi:leader peptidase (prepilin peptidase)/N-methyltransferase